MKEKYHFSHTRYRVVIKILIMIFPAILKSILVVKP